MLNFKTDYLLAMQDQAPGMMRELREAGALEAHLDQKAEEARQLFVILTKDAETLPNSGAIRSPQVEQEATELVYATVIEFGQEGE